MFKFLSLLFLILNFSCNRSYMVKSESTKIHVDQVNVLAVAYRRPDYLPSDHDDFSVKNRELDCQSSNELWKDILIDQLKVRQCLNEIEDGHATYFYVPDAKPYLELDSEDTSNPKCLITSLSKIPLPREIYYLGLQEGMNANQSPMGCYASSFSVKTNQLFLTKNEFLKKKISIPFPLDRPLKSTQDLSIWLMVTTFTILKSDEKANGSLMATHVPELLCRACFKHDALFNEKYRRRIKPVFWP